MRRILLFMFACIFIVGCNNDSDSEKAIREQMDALYGENKELTAIPDGQPYVSVENGVYVGKLSDGVNSFKGIPYAQPPVGKLRWHAPQRPDSSTSIKEAYYFGKSAIQTLAESEWASYYKQGEDCLTLNIWSSNDSTSSRPVMVWIHGGSYGWGGTSDPLYDGHNFIKAHPEVILVTINYRIGIMGFLDLTQMPGGEEFKESGNLGLLDQIAALEWIQRNISAFGGDASQVTIFGESAGGGSVSLLPIMPKAKGLFHRVIAQSGSVALSSSKEECKLLIDRLKEVTGANNVSDLMKLSEAELMRFNEVLNEYNCFPHRDGSILPLDPYKAYADGAAKNIDLMMGTNSDEVRYWIGEMGGAAIFKLALPVWYDNILQGLPDNQRKDIENFVENRADERIWNICEFMNELMFRIPMLTMADAHSSAGGNTYVYYWSCPSSLPERGACHAVELAYVLNNPEETIYTGDTIDLKLASEAQNMWVNFAIKGNPSTSKNVFPRYDNITRKSLRIDHHIKVEEDLLASQRQLVSPLIQQYISPLYCNMSLNVPTVWCYATWILIPLVIIVSAIIWLLIRRRNRKQ